MFESNGDQQRRGSGFDQMLSCLSDRTRRRVLTALTEHNPRQAEEFEPSDLTSAKREYEEFEVELYHNHLPRLRDAGFIEWDRDSGTITRGPRFDEIEPLLTLIVDHQDELPADWP